MPDLQTIPQSIPELQKFRQKYPMYNSLDDSTLASKLASKYPDAYGDLPKKLSQVKSITSTDKPLDDNRIVGYDSNNKPIIRNLSQIDSINGNQADSMAVQEQAAQHEEFVKQMLNPVSPYKEREKQFQSSIMPEVTSTAKKGNDFPVFNQFKKKYKLPSNFGIGDLKDFYNQIYQMPNSQAKANALKDYQNVTQEFSQRVGQKNLYNQMQLPQTSVKDVNPNEQRLKDVSNLLHKSITGEGEGAFLNPLGAVIQGAKSGVEQGVKGVKQYFESSLNPNEKSLSDKTFGIIGLKAGQIEGIGNLASGAFKTGMSLYPELAVANMASIYASPVAEHIGAQIGGEEEIGRASCRERV